MELPRRDSAGQPAALCRGDARGAHGQWAVLADIDRDSDRV